MAAMTPALRDALFRCGVECSVGDGGEVSDRAVFEAPCGLKSMATQHGFDLGAFSYGVSGFYSEVSIGRYCSIGEDVQIGRGAHPVAWMSTSPFFYAYSGRMLNVGTDFAHSLEYGGYKPTGAGEIPIRNSRTVNDFLQKTTIGNDVWIGHGAFIAAGISVGDGAVVAGHSVVTRDVPPYAIVGGNPAQILRMRFDLRQCASLQALAWWKFAPWQLVGTPFAYIELAISHLHKIAPGLSPYSGSRVAIADIIRGA